MQKTIIAIFMAITATTAAADGGIIGRQAIDLPGHRLTPEALWAMGRIASATASPDGKTIAYQVGYYSVAQNKGHQVIATVDAKSKATRQLTTTADSETDPAWTADGRIAFITKGDVWTMAKDGTDRKQLTATGDIDAFKIAKNGKRIVLVKTIPFHNTIEAKPQDLPLTTGRICNDLMYRHWDHYVEAIQHPYIADILPDGTAGKAKDIMEGEPYECPMEPFGGIEQIDINADATLIAYTCRKKTGRDYAISTDSDIYLYDIVTGTTRNLCKTKPMPACDTYTSTLATSPINSPENIEANNPGYDTNPQFSPDGSRIAWQSMPRDGYESDRNRLCIFSLADSVKTYATESLDTNVEGFCWAPDSHTLYFNAVWHGCFNAYQTDIEDNVRQLTDDWADIVSLSLANDGGKLLAIRQSYQAPNDIYIIAPGKKTKIEQLTFENKHILDQLHLGRTQQRWVKTTDGKQMLVWIVLPADFDESKRYPTLLFCEGGPQSPVSQFWSFRWNMQMMAANGYIVVAPNRHGLPGFGSEWNEQVSGNWTGQCMDDYLAAIDDAANNLPYVDKDRLGAVGASFGGFSVYWLAGHHNKRFKAFIAHDGAFNLESMYTDTEEAWFSNWEYDDAFWRQDKTQRAKRTYDESPHKAVDNWDTPILCIHGEKDYRINYNQGMGAFNAARMKGIPAQLLIFPDENHWVLKPQNGILWQRTYFNWLDKWLKK